jgi:A/G-specific adenine glycosylase
VELSKESFAEWAAQYPGLLSDDNCHLIQKEVKHVLTHRILLADLYLWEPEQQPHLPSGYQWVAEASLDDYALPRLVEKLIATL